MNHLYNVSFFLTYQLRLFLIRISLSINVQNLVTDGCTKRDRAKETTSNTPLIVTSEGSYLTLTGREGGGREARGQVGLRYPPHILGEI